MDAERVVLVALSGKWQARIFQTLLDAGYACTIRQIRIRCGVLADPYGTLMRNTLARMVKAGLLTVERRGLYCLHTIDVLPRLESGDSRET